MANLLPPLVFAASITFLALLRQLVQDDLPVILVLTVFIVPTWASFPLRVVLLKRHGNLVVVAPVEPTREIVQDGRHCPTCGRELGDSSHVRGLYAPTCPFCGQTCGYPWRQFFLVNLPTLVCVGIFLFLFAGGPEENEEVPFGLGQAWDVYRGRLFLVLVLIACFFVLGALLLRRFGTLKPRSSSSKVDLSTLVSRAEAEENKSAIVVAGAAMESEAIQKKSCEFQSPPKLLQDPTDHDPTSSKASN